MEPPLPIYYIYSCLENLSTAYSMNYITYSLSSIVAFLFLGGRHFC